MKKEVLFYLIENIDLIKKLKVEEFNSRLLVDIVLVNSIISLDISNEKLRIDHNDSTRKYLLDFYSEEKELNSLEEFKEYLNNIFRGIKTKTEGITVVYKDEEYLCEIEVEAIGERGMGTEIIYTVSFESNDGEEIEVANLCEYPVGSYSFYNVNPLVLLDESEALSYLHRLSADTNE